jgi:RecA-family ATPase
MSIFPLLNTPKVKRVKPNANQRFPTLTQRPPLFTPLSELIANRKTISWLIRDYLPLDTTCMLYGASGAGKSFIMLDMALHIASGKEWQGQKTKQGAVFYIAGEGVTGLTARAKAWLLHNESTEVDVPFYCTDGALILPDKANLKELIDNVSYWVEETGVNPSLIVFDTMARCFSGEENSAKDASEYIKAMDILRKKFNCCVTNVHHTGKDASKEARGSSAFKGAWDMEHLVKVNKGIIELSTPKAKDSKTPTPKFFNLKEVATDWIDDDNEVVTSAVIVSTNAVLPVNKANMLNARQQDVLDSLHKALKEHGTVPTEELKELIRKKGLSIPLLIVHKDKWRGLVYEVLKPNGNANQNTLRGAFNDAQNKLIEVNKVSCLESYVWIS